MFRHSLFRLGLLVALFGLVLSSFAVDAQQDTSKRGRKYKSPPPTARIEVTVLRDVNGKPIENAAVIFHPMEGEKDKGNMELKTNEDGKTVIDVLPIGDTVRMQIIAKGFQTFGDDYKIDKARIAIEIRMKRPGEQYSIYKPHPETSEGGKSPDADKPADKPASPTPAPAGKPAPKPDAQPSPSQPK
jgi:5-hydroxyisourate hydrolase-like protein (transthyretin family)